MFAIISTLRPTETKKLIDEVRQHRSIKGEEDPNQLVEIDPRIFKEIQSVFFSESKVIVFKWLIWKYSAFQKGSLSIEIVN